MKLCMDQRSLERSREMEEMNRERGRETEKEGGGSVTSAITSSEMHLDRVSICQNKAASTAASLMAVDVSDRGGGEMVGWHLHIQRGTKKLLLHASHRHTYTHTYTRESRMHTQTKQLQLLFS